MIPSSRDLRVLARRRDPSLAAIAPELAIEVARLRGIVAEAIPWVRAAAFRPLPGGGRLILDDDAAEVLSQMEER